MSVPELIQGGSFKDHRGQLSFVNDFSFSNVKRFYQINNAGIEQVRAWQGHQIEHKYFYAATGSFVVAWVKIDNWNDPTPEMKAEHIILSDQHPAVLSIPPGYANGIKSLEADSSLLIFSNLAVDESEKDRWTYNSALWLNWQQFKI